MKKTFSVNIKNGVYLRPSGPKAGWGVNEEVCKTGLS